MLCAQLCETWMKWLNDELIVDQTELFPDPMGLRDYGAGITGREGRVESAWSSHHLSLHYPDHLRFGEERG